MKANILITGAGGAAAISFLKAVENDLDCDYFMGDIDPFAAGLYLVSEDRRIILPRGDDPAFVEDILRICCELDIDVLVPTVDCELLPLASAKMTFDEIGVRLLLADEKTLKVCLDKDELMRRCEVFVGVPRSEVLNSFFEPQHWSFPLFVKPRIGSGSRGIMTIENAADLEQQAHDGSMLIQELLPGAEYSVDVLADQDGNILAVVPRERLKVDSGIAVASRTVNDAELIKQAGIVANLIGLKFTANIQFKRNANGEPCLLEVNPRFPGTMPLTVASGVNMPLISLKNILGLDIDEDNLFWREIAVVRTWQEHFIEPAEITRLQRQKHHQPRFAFA